MLYLAWRQPDRRWWPVGRLTYANGAYEFAYTKGATSAAASGFRPLLSFPDLEQTYVSRQLFPVFANRVPPKTRPDYDAFVEGLGVGSTHIDPIALLARSGGRRETDMFELFPVPEQNADGRYEATFFVHGLRHRGPDAEAAARSLHPGDLVRLVPEPANPEDPHALGVVAVVSATRLGFLPRYLCEDVHRLREHGRDELHTVVRRVNPPPTPAQFRVLCTLAAPWPRGFRPLSSPDFDPLHALAPASHGA